MKNNESVAEKTRKLLKLCKDTYFSGVHLVVTGHDKPDSDSLISSWLLLRLAEPLHCQWLALRPRQFSGWF